MGFLFMGFLKGRRKKTNRRNFEKRIYEFLFRKNAKQKRKKEFG